MKANPMNEILEQLRKPFHPSHVTWKPGSVNKDGTKALALAYADLRAYMRRLDEVCGMAWSVTYTPWGERIVCHLTIDGVTRSSTGESDSQSERSEIGGTSAEAQAFKRACAMFGVGRYLYELPTVWVEYDKGFTDRAKARLEGVIVQHYQRVMDERVVQSSVDDSANHSQKDDAEPSAALMSEFEALGAELYAEQWESVKGHNTERITGGASTKVEDLSADQIGKLVEGMKKLKRKRKPLTGVVAQVATGK